jgi:hypothetical protein
MRNIKSEIKERMFSYRPSFGGKEGSRKGCRPIASKYHKLNRRNKTKSEVKERMVP